MYEDENYVFDFNSNENLDEELNKYLQKDEKELKSESNNSKLKSSKTSPYPLDPI